MRTNYHTHTYRCHHASGTEEDYIIEGIANIGFTNTTQSNYSWIEEGNN